MRLANLGCGQHMGFSLAAAVGAWHAGPRLGQSVKMLVWSWKTKGSYNCKRGNLGHATLGPNLPLHRSIL
jgi:hypothetical protein